MQHLDIAGMHVATAGSGDPLVFVHGFTTTSSFWEQQVALFSATHQVVTLDLPGHGASTKDVGRQYTIDAFANDILRVLDHLNIDRAVLVGLSMGGTIVQTAYFAQPQRVEALVLVGTTAHGLGPKVREAAVLSRIEQVGVEEASREVIRHSFAPGTPDRIIAWAEREVIKTPRHVAEEAIRSLNGFDSRGRLAEIRVPTLIVVGAEDTITPVAESRSLHRNIMNSQIQIIERAAHFPMVEQPAAFNSSLSSFLRSLSAARRHQGGVSGISVE